jgi:hypothetical protein
VTDRQTSRRQRRRQTSRRQSDRQTSRRQSDRQTSARQGGRQTSSRQCDRQTSRRQNDRQTSSRNTVMSDRLTSRRRRTDKWGRAQVRPKRQKRRGTVADKYKQEGEGKLTDRRAWGHTN